MDPKVLPPKALAQGADFAFTRWFLQLPEGHTFERCQSMTAPAPEKCDVCGAAPLELVLYPVAIHYKGSGFYTTDYGKGKAAKKEGESSSPSSGR